MRYKVKKTGKSQLFSIGVAVCLCAGVGTMYAGDPPLCKDTEWTCVSDCANVQLNSDGDTTICENYFQPNTVNCKKLDPDGDDLGILCEYAGSSANYPCVSISDETCLCRDEAGDSIACGSEG